MLNALVKGTLRQLCRALQRRHGVESADPAAIAAFVLAQLERQPWPVRLGLRCLTLVLELDGLRYGQRFSRLPAQTQLRLISDWSASRLRLPPLLIRFYRSLVLLQAGEPLPAPGGAKAGAPRIATELAGRADVVVVGSGPGGALSATLLAEAGLRVTLLEEGDWPGRYAPYSCAEMGELMRHGGLGVIPGPVPVSLVEARCVGGASEFNSGLYRRAPQSVLDDWARQQGVTGLEEATLAACWQANERELAVQWFDGEQPPAAQRLVTGAQALAGGGRRWVSGVPSRRAHPGRMARGRPIGA